MNDQGQVIGYLERYDEICTSLYSSFRTKPDGSVEQLPSGFSPAAINNHGDVVGSVNDATGDSEAVVVKADGSIINLGPGGAADINDAGVVVGAIGGKAFRWSVEAGLEYLPIGETASSSGADAINSGGQIAGRIDSQNVRWDIDGTFTAIGGSVHPSRINSSGYILVFFSVWDPNTHDFIDFGGTAVVRDINDNGLVVGSRIHEGKRVAWAWQIDVHEPSTGEHELVLSCSSPVTRGSTVACAVDGDTAFVVGQWWFGAADSDYRYARPTTTDSTWSGEVAAGGTVFVSVIVNGITDTLSTDFAVLDRDWSWVPYATLTEDTADPLYDHKHDLHSLDPGGWICELNLGCPLVATEGYFFPDWSSAQFGNGYELTSIGDTGPNHGLWYVAHASWVMELGTRVNPFALPSSDARWPAADCATNPTSIYEYNECKNVDIDGWIEASRRHERWHGDLLMDSAQYYDPRQAVEGIYAAAQADVGIAIYNRVRRVTVQLAGVASIPDKAGEPCPLLWGLDNSDIYRRMQGAWDKTPYPICYR